MGIEIERKFLVRSAAWRAPAGRGTPLRQGYLNSAPERAVRVRCAAGRGFLTIKGPSSGPARPEYEYEIPPAEAEAMLETLAERPLIEKIRYRVEHEGLIWEIDEFFGVNAGLILAELELSSPDQAFNKPAWAGMEVTEDHRYTNAALVRHPYSAW